MGYIIVPNTVMQMTAAGMKKIVGTKGYADIEQAPRALPKSMAEMETTVIDMHGTDGGIGMMHTIACNTEGHPTAKDHATVIGRDSQKVMRVVKCTILIVASCSGAVCPVRPRAEMLPVLDLVRVTSMLIADCQLIRVVSTGML
jgi:hypothetical protein